MKHRCKVAAHQNHVFPWLEIGMHVAHAENDKTDIYAHAQKEYIAKFIRGAKYMGVLTEINSHEGYLEYDDGVDARRDGNGSLMCDGCEQPFPYAEPVDGKFTCYGCRSFR